MRTSQIAPNGGRGENFPKSRRRALLVVVQHHIAEGPGELLNWANQRSIDLIVSRADMQERPLISGVPVVLLGGPYSLLDPPHWLQSERLWVRDLVAAGTPIFGISLGAHLIAEALGGSIRALARPETGWSQIRLNNGRKLNALQWHEDTFSLPPGAIVHGRSEHCENQYFSVGEKYVGVQFHPEWNAESISQLDFFYGNASPVLFSGHRADTRRHNIVKAWFHAQLNRWFKNLRRQVGRT